MNIDLKKQEVLNNLLALENECRILLERIPSYREELLNVKTEEEAIVFDETHNLEDGLKIVCLS